MNVKYLVAALAATVVLGSASQAADVMMPIEVSPIVAKESTSVVVPVFSWTGFYIGGKIGSLLR